MKVISFVSFTPLAPYYAGESVEIDSLSDFFSGFMEEIEMFEDRYFIAEPNGIADRVLTKMERAGGKILEALSAIDPFCKTVVPAQLVLNGQLKGFSILPCDPALKSMWIDELARDYAALKTEVSARTLDSKIAVVAPLVSPNSPFTYSPTIVPALREIRDNVPYLGMNPNIAVMICQAVKNERKSISLHPEKAVLSVNGYDFYPEARRVFATWVIKLPAYIPQYGNDFIPPTCRPISFDDLASLITPMDRFDEFTTRHEAARNRITSLEKINLETPPMK